MEKKSRLIELRFAKHIQEPVKRVFLCDYPLKIGPTEGEDEYYTLRQMMAIWGYEQFYDEMVQRLAALIQKNVYETVVLCYDTGELTKDIEHQKLFFWNIYDDRARKQGLVGGVLFQNNEMSFHT